MKTYHELDKQREKEFLEKYYLDILNDVTLFDGVKEAFAKLKEMGCTLALVTARGIYSQEIGKPTLKVLQKFGIEFDEYYWGNPIKGHVCKDNHIDIMIDDLESVCEDVTSCGIKALYFGEPSKKFDYALSWDDVVKYMERTLI